MQRNRLLMIDKNWYVLLFCCLLCCSLLYWLEVHPLYTIYQAQIRSNVQHQLYVTQTNQTNIEQHNKLCQDLTKQMHILTQYKQQPINNSAELTQLLTYLSDFAQIHSIPMHIKNNQISHVSHWLIEHRFTMQIQTSLSQLFYFLNILATLNRLTHIHTITILHTPDSSLQIQLNLGFLQQSKFITNNKLYQQQCHPNIQLSTQHPIGSQYIQHQVTTYPQQMKRHKKHKIKTFAIILHYAKAATIAQIIQGKPGSMLSTHGVLRVDTRSNQLWIQDYANKIHTIQKFIQQTDIALQQVDIEARIVHIMKEATTDLGIRFHNPIMPLQQGHTQQTAFNFIQLDFGPMLEGAGALGLALTKLGQGILLDMELAALESENKATIIANPHLITINQHTAIIESGEEIPYQETNNNGASTVTFKKAVLSLKVTPSITPNGKLLMQLEINQDTPSSREINGVPAITTKSIHTEVLVNNRETLVLGGIYKKNEDNTLRRVPFWAEIPVINTLFRHRHHRINNEELLIFITPRIMSKSLYFEGADSAKH